MITYSFFIYPYEQTESVSDDVLITRIKIWRREQLRECDWTQLGDVPITNKADWIRYRKELRDLPSQGTDPKKWVFPVKPA